MVSHVQGADILGRDVAGSSITVLHVDDDEPFAELFSEVAKQRGEDVTVHSRHDGAEALAFLETTDAVDCVVSDYEMPGMDGLELLEAVRERWPDLPFVLFTGQGDESVAEQAINADVTDYVQKRTGLLQFTVLLNRVQQVVEQRRRQASLERELRVEKEHFRMALENSPFVAFRLDTDLRYTWVGNPHEDFDAEAVLGKRDDELLPPEAAETIMAPKRKALETGERVREEVTYELPSGEVTYDLTVEPLRDDSGEILGLTCASMDVTERKEYQRQLERATQRTEAQFELLVDTVEDYAIFFLDTNGYVRSWNQGAENILGYASEEIVGEHVSVFYPDGADSDADAGPETGAGGPEQRLREATAEQHTKDEGWRVRKDGSRFWADVRVTAIRREDELLGYAEIVRDSTQRKRERDLLEHKQQLEDLIASISHDLRTPLLTAGGNVQLARRTGDVSRLEAAEQALNRTEELLDHLGRLAAEGREIGEPELVDLRGAAETAWAVLETGPAELFVDGDVAFMADEQRLQQLFENLFTNSIAHGGSDVRVTVGPLAADTGFYVADDGPGIPVSEQDDVFERGYSGRDDHTGFGLAICARIANAHGWQMSVTDSGDGGARFEVSGVETV